MAQKRLALTDEEERARRTLDLFKRLTDMSDEDIAAQLGLKYQAIQQRRKGYTRIHPWRDVPPLAEALGIDPVCFAMTDAQLLDWIEAHRPDLLMPSSPWITAPAALIA